MASHELNLSRLGMASQGRSRGLLEARASLHHGIGFRSRKNPPVGPSSGSVASASPSSARTSSSSSSSFGSARALLLSGSAPQQNEAPHAQCGRSQRQRNGGRLQQQAGPLVHDPQHVRIPTTLSISVGPAREAMPRISSRRASLPPAARAVPQDLARRVVAARAHHARGKVGAPIGPGSRDPRRSADAEDPPGAAPGTR
jgi:hypothetical protein